MHKLKISLLLLTVSVCFFSCLKDDTFMDVAKTEPLIEFSYGTNGLKDLGNFGVSVADSVIDTAIAVNIASPQVLDYDVTVTLKIDPTLLTKYNNVAGNTQLTMLPDSTFSYNTTTVIIRAGHRIGRIPLKLFPAKIDLATSYGLPIAIVSAKGSGGQSLMLSGNAGIALYAFIGNPLAGPYTWNFHRWNAPDSTSAALHALSFDGDPTLFTPKTPTQVEVQSGYYIGPRYELTFDNNGGILSNFNVEFNADDVTTMSGAGVTVSSITIIAATVSPDLQHAYFKFQFVATTGNGPRYLTDEFYR